MEEHTLGSVERIHPSHREAGVGRKSEKTRDAAKRGVRGGRLVEHLPS
jgi:hypothetical protein